MRRRADLSKIEVELVGTGLENVRASPVALIALAGPPSTVPTVPTPAACLHRQRQRQGRALDGEQEFSYKESITFM